MDLLWWPINVEKGRTFGKKQHISWGHTGKYANLLCGFLLMGSPAHLEWSFDVSFRWVIRWWVGNICRGHAFGKYRVEVYIWLRIGWRWIGIRWWWSWFFSWDGPPGRAVSCLSRWSWCWSPGRYEGNDCLFGDWGMRTLQKTVGCWAWRFF